MDARRKSEKHKQLMSLLLTHQQRIFGFIFTLVQHRADAEDLLQEASLIMWEKFDDFDLETDFVAWANQIAFFCVKNFRRRRSRSPLLFNDELLERIAGKTAEQSAELDLRHHALQDCLGELRPRDRSMVLRRYSPEGGVAAAAEDAQRTITATYKALSRVRRALLTCVTKRLATEVGR